LKTKEPAFVENDIEWSRPTHGRSAPLAPVIADPNRISPTSEGRPRDNVSERISRLHLSGCPMLPPMSKTGQPSEHSPDRRRKSMLFAGAKNKKEIAKSDPREHRNLTDITQAA
jgi:hypothetical protein